MHELHEIMAQELVDRGTDRYERVSARLVDVLNQPFSIAAFEPEDKSQVAIDVFCYHDGSFDFEINGRELFEREEKPSNLVEPWNAALQEIRRFADNGYVEVRTAPFLGALSPIWMGSGGDTDPNILSALSRRFARRSFSLEPWPASGSSRR